MILFYQLQEFRLFIKQKLPMPKYFFWVDGEMICGSSQDLPLALQNWHSNRYCFKPSESKLQQIGIIVFNFYICLLHSEQNLKFTCFLFVSLNPSFVLLCFPIPFFLYLWKSPSSTMNASR